MTELYEVAQRLGVKNVRIEEDKWDKYYSNFYNILALEGRVNKHELIFAAEEAIFMYEMRKAGYDDA